MHDAQQPGQEQHGAEEARPEGVPAQAAAPEPPVAAEAAAPEESDGVGEELTASLKALREQADALDAMPLDERKVAAAEQVAEAAAALDEQIGSIARSDDH